MPCTHILPRNLQADLQRYVWKRPLQAYRSARLYQRPIDRDYLQGPALNVTAKLRHGTAFKVTRSSKGDQRRHITRLLCFGVRCFFAGECYSMTTHSHVSTSSADEPHFVECHRPLCNWRPRSRHATPSRLGDSEEPHIYDKQFDQQHTGVIVASGALL